MADDVDLWEHIRYDDTAKMAIDEADLAAALAAAKPPRDPHDQSVDELLAEIEAFAVSEPEPEPEPEPAAEVAPEPAEPAAVADDPAAALAAIHAAPRGRWRRRFGRRPGPVDPPEEVVEPGTPPPADVEVVEPETDADADDTDPGALISQIGERKAREAEDDDSGEGAVVDAAVVFHDRMRERRIAVRRDEGLRRLRRLAWVLGGLVLLVDGAALAHTSLADVDHVVVQGGAQTSAGAIRAASGIHTHDALLTLDEQGAERSIEELSWVAGADVQRRWPDTVRITVTERTPAAVLQSAAPGLPLALVDASGRVLQIGGAVPPGLVTVTDVPPVMREGAELPEKARAALRIALAAPQRAPGAITTVSTRLEGTLIGGGVVRFGSLDHLDEKLVALATVLARVDTSCLGVLDVKVPGSPTVSRRPC